MQVSSDFEQTIGEIQRSLENLTKHQFQEALMTPPRSQHQLAAHVGDPWGVPAEASMKTAQVIYEDGGHKWYAIVRDASRPNYLIDTNEYLVVAGDDAILLDPGGSEVFPAVFSALSAGLRSAPRRPSCSLRTRIRTSFPRCRCGSSSTPTSSAT